MTDAPRATPKAVRNSSVNADRASTPSIANSIVKAGWSLSTPTIHTAIHVIAAPASAENGTARSSSVFHRCIGSAEMRLKRSVQIGRAHV